MLVDSAVKRVLLVDDEDRLRGVLARYLRARGHHVIEATTAAQARYTLECEPIDILVLDVNLSDETGWSILRWLRERHTRGFPDQQPRVVIMSAVPPMTRRIEEFSPDAVLNKPFPIDALGRLVESTRHADDFESARHG